ncbi:MAG: hypothetical protein ABJ242_00010 [Marinomonas sp.]
MTSNEGIFAENRRGIFGGGLRHASCRILRKYTLCERAQKRRIRPLELRTCRA